MSTKKTIAICSGDGIGPEIMEQTLRVLDAIAHHLHHEFDYVVARIGGDAYMHEGSHCPESTLTVCEEADAILLGAVGGPVHQQHLAQWKNCEANSILKLRKHFQFNINMRPIQIYPELMMHSPLKPEKIGSGIDILVCRELTGGLYFGTHEYHADEPQKVAQDTCTYSADQIESIAHAAFQAAQQRQQRLCSVDKSNVLATSQLWRDTMNNVSLSYPEVTLTHMLVDNCAMQLIINPKQFDVIVTENLFGDILSDLAGALPGSLGCIPSASFNQKHKGLYEPAHGSAPDIAQQNIANPSAQILSAALMLRYSFGLHQEAQLIEDAVKYTIAQGVVTADLLLHPANAASTVAFTDAIIDYISQHALISTHST